MAWVSSLLSVEPKKSEMLTESLILEEGIPTKSKTKRKNRMTSRVQVCSRVWTPASI